MNDLLGALRVLIEPYLAEEGVELYDLELGGVGANLRLRVLVDAEGGIDVDRLASVSRLLKRLLDAQQAMPGPYGLEVSSPGLERPLRRYAHYLKAVGSDVRVKARGPSGQTQTYRGRLMDADEDRLVVAVGIDEVTIAVQDVTSARTVYELERRAKPGSARRSR